MDIERVIERTLYHPIASILEETQFQDVLTEARQGTAAKFTDLTFSYEHGQKKHKFLVEVKFGDVAYETPKSIVLSQTRDYAKRKGTKNYIILTYPKSLRGSKIIGDEWLRDKCINEKIRCNLSTEIWTTSLLESPKKVFQELMINIIKNKTEHDQEYIVKQLKTAVEDLLKINQYANKAKLVDEVVTKIQLFTGISGLDDEKQKYLEQELVNLSIYLLFNQLLFYRIYRLRVENNELPPLKNIKSKNELQTFFGKIENKGYRAIYQVNILEHLSDRPKVIETINEVIEAIKSLRPEQITHDIAGIFFHKLIPQDIRKVLATYYTVPNAADLLAGLSVQSSDETVFDPACGSGTLLVASYKRKESF